MFRLSLEPPRTAVPELAIRTYAVVHVVRIQQYNTYYSKSWYVPHWTLDKAPSPISSPKGVPYNILPVPLRLLYYTIHCDGMAWHIYQLSTPFY